jgi:hypothetical protein
MIASAIDLLHHLDSQQKENLRINCIQIDSLQGHCKDNVERQELQRLYREREKIICGKRSEITCGNGS